MEGLAVGAIAAGPARDGRRPHVAAGHVGVRRPRRRPAASPRSPPGFAPDRRARLLVPVEPDDPGAPGDVRALGPARPRVPRRAPVLDASGLHRRRQRSRPVSPPVRPTTSWPRDSDPGSTARSSSPPSSRPAGRAVHPGHVGRGPAGHARRGLRHPAGVQRRPVDGRDHRRPHHRAPGGGHRRAGHDVAPPGHPRGATAGTGVEVLVGGETAGGVDAAALPLVAAVLGHRRRHRPGLPPPDGGVPVGGDPREGRRDEPVVGGRRLRRDRRRLPVGMGGLDHRDRQHRAHRPLDPAHDVHHPLRAVDGLRGVPALEDARGVAADTGQHHIGGRRPGQDGPGHHRRRRHHDLRLRVLRHR